MFALLRLLGYMLSRRKKESPGSTGKSRFPDEPKRTNANANEDWYETDQMAMGSYHTPKVLLSSSTPCSSQCLTFQANKFTSLNPSFTSKTQRPVLEASPE